jgi:hypothetical protein
MLAHMFVHIVTEIPNHDAMFGAVLRHGMQWMTAMLL